jgi:hypothetical protein
MSTSKLQLDQLPTFKTLDHLAIAMLIALVDHTVQVTTSASGTLLLPSLPEEDSD